MADHQISKFKGINNVADRLRMSEGWLSVADNVDITNTGAIVRRAGSTLALACSPTAAYTTKDYSRMYIVNNGVVTAVTSDMQLIPLYSLTAATTMYWAEINQQVYFYNGTDGGVILPNNVVLPLIWTPPATPTLMAISGNLDAGLYHVSCTFILADGRETGNSVMAEIVLTQGQAIRINNIPQVAGATTAVYIQPANSAIYQLAMLTTNTSEIWNSSADQLGRELLYEFLDPLPLSSTSLTFWKSRLHVAQFLPASNTTVIWRSKPLAFHLFDLNAEFILVPGEVLMLCPTDDALVIGTGQQIFSYDGDKLTENANYGVVRGASWAADENDQKWFWSSRGLCQALPFSNVTIDQMSVQSGDNVGAGIVFRNGVKQFVAALHQGGTAFNPRT